MALAVLRFEEATGDLTRFQVDIGHNRFYQYQIGDDEVRHSGGLAVLANPRYESGIAGPLPPASLGRTIIDVPIGFFGRNTRFVQLTSFRELPDVGTAISDIVEVPFGILPPGLPQEEKRSLDVDDEPISQRRQRQFVPRRETSIMQQQMSKTGRIPINVHGNFGISGNKPAYTYMKSRANRSMSSAVPFTYREARYSNAMFLGALGSLLSSALPVVSQVVSGLGGAGGIARILGGLFGGSTSSTTPEANPSGANPQSITPDIARQIAEVIRLLSAPQQAAPSTNATTSSVTQQGTQQTISRSLSKSGYSQQMIAPALLAAIPALMPLLEKALNPQTINAVLSNVGPNATIGAVTDAIKDIGGMNIQAYQNIMDHIQKNMPSNDTTPFLNHLLAVTESLSEPSILPSYRRVDAVEIRFVPQTLVMLRGREQMVYRIDAPQGLAFPLTIDTPRPIRHATLYVILKEAETLRVILENKWDLVNVKTGALSEIPHLSTREISGATPGMEYLVCAYLVWKTKDGELIGTSRTQFVHFMSEYAYQGTETEGEIVPLNDVEKFRPYWHKVWQDSFTREKRRWEWDCKYYYTLSTESDESTHLETVTEETPGAGRRVEGRLKSGLRLSISELNALLPQISSYPALNSALLDVLSAPAPIAAFGRAARSKVQFRGSEGDSVALWVYPEMRIQPIVLLRAGTTDTNGLVTEFIEEIVRFPIPALAHFIGVSTEKNPFPALDEDVEDI